LTTLIQEIVEAADTTSPITAAQAEALVKAAFGLDGALNLTKLDLIAAAQPNTPAFQAQKAAAAIAEVINAAVENGGNQAGALGAIGELANDGNALQLTNAAVLSTIIVASGVAPENVAAVVAEAKAVTDAIAQAEDLGELTGVQGNKAPVAMADFAGIAEDAAIVAGSRPSLLANDNDGESDPLSTDQLTVTEVSGVAVNGLTTINGAYGTLKVAADGTYSYETDDVVDAYKAGVQLNDTFSYSISDGKGGIATSTLTIAISTTDDTQSRSFGNGKDRFTGTGADEILLGGRGDDVLDGSAGADRLYGEQGDDRLGGGDGFDLLVGGQGDDRLSGGSGNDLLVGGKGSDILFGDAGADVFEFGDTGRTNDRDVIRDFEFGVDTIHLSNGLTITGHTEGRESTTLQLSNGGTIVLAGVTGISDFAALQSPDLPDWSSGLLLV
jgi:VCBS repeat-containing protein